MDYEIRYGIMLLALSALFILVVSALIHFLIPTLKWVAKVFKRSFWRGVLAVIFVTAMVYYGGSKGTIKYPYTDSEQRYLIDRGSYVTNDFIHIDFERIIAPISAPLFGSYRLVSSTNDADWITFLDTTFADFAVPTNLPFASATNYNFVLYTTWTPGPTVQTNGVWHANWGLDRKYQQHYIPIRTTVRKDGVIIATPKSKEEQ